MGARKPPVEGGRRKYHRFLLTPAARSLGIAEVARLSPADALALFRSLRFGENGGDPFCVHCGCTAVYEFKTRALFKCQACERQFSLTSGTMFASRKLPVGDILLAIALFVNGVNGVSALRLSRDLNVSYKSAFVLAHKLRDAMGDIQSEARLTGEVEIDGIIIGGKVRKANMVKERVSRRAEHQKLRRVIVTMRERGLGGRSRAFVFKSEHESVSTVLKVVDPAARLFTDYGDAWERLVIPFADVQRVNHSLGYSVEGIHINGVENQNSRTRRAERGIYLGLNRAHLQRYADELCWRDDHRRVDNGRQFLGLAKRVAAMKASRAWVGYWQKGWAERAAAAA